MLYTQTNICAHVSPHKHTLTQTGTHIVLHIHNTVLQNQIYKSILLHTPAKKMTQSLRKYSLSHTNKHMLTYTQTRKIATARNTRCYQTQTLTHSILHIENTLANRHIDTHLVCTHLKTDKKSTYSQLPADICMSTQTKNS